MKALCYLKPNILKIQNIESPACAEGEALIRVHSAGICGTDLAIAAGEHPRAKPPLVMGHEFAGEVVEIGSLHAQTNLAVGDKVTAFPLLFCGKCWACINGFEHVCRNLKLIGIDRDGAFAEYVNVPLDLVVKLPENLTYEQGALVEPLAVGIHALEMAGDPTLQIAVVIGAGPIGLLVGLCLQKSGIKNIIMTEINAHRLQRAKRLGFNVLNSAEVSVADEVNRASKNEGADIVFECAGTTSAAQQMCELVRSRGKVVVVSTHKEPDPINLQKINFKELIVIGTRVYTRRNYQNALEIVQDFPIEELVSDRIDLDNAADGFELMKKSEDICKVIIEME